MGIFFSNFDIKKDDDEVNKTEPPKNESQGEYTFLQHPSGVIIVDCKTPPVILPDDPSLPEEKLYVETNFGLMDYDDLMKARTAMNMGGNNAGN